jgi:hypothetical protein
MAERVVARILMGKRRYDGLYEEVLIRLVRIGMPEIAGIPRGALVELRGRVLYLRIASQYSRKNDRGVVKALLRRADKLLRFAAATSYRLKQRGS